MNWSACHERETTSTRQDSNHPPDLRRTYEERGHILGSLFSYETVRGHELLLLEVPIQSHAEMFSSRAANHFNLAFWAPQFQFHGQFNMPFLKKKGRIFLPQIHYFTILKLLLYIYFLTQPYNHSWPLLNNYVQTWNRFKLLTDVKKSGVWNTCKRVSLNERYGGSWLWNI